MASVHFGQLSGPAGFSRVVAIKRLHPNLAKDPDFVTMFLEEARLAARIRHLNVVSTLDVVANDGEVFLVMEYVHGQTLANLRKAVKADASPIDPRIVSAVMSGVCHGLHAAHEAKGERGEPLRVVHRDVSPQNILVGVDGMARVLDFGVAKAAGRVQTTSEGRIKGKLAYMPPEQLHGVAVTRRTDVYAAGVVTWEFLTGKRAYSRPNEAAVITAILEESLPPPSHLAPHTAAFDAIVMRALSRNPHQRYATALEMARDLERCTQVASMSEVGAWVLAGAREELERRARRVALIDESVRASLASIPPRSRSPSEMPTKPGVPPPVPEPDAISGISHVAVSPASSRLIRPLHRRVVLRVSASAAGLLGVVLLARCLAGAGSRADAMSATTLELVSARPDVRVLSAPLLPPATERERWAAAAMTAEERTAAKGGASSRPTSGATGPGRGKAKRECDPPFSIDDHGHKHYKASCLE